MGVYLTGMHLMGVHLMGVYLMGVYGKQPPYLVRGPYQNLLCPT